MLCTDTAKPQSATVMMASVLRMLLLCVTMETVAVSVEDGPPHQQQTGDLVARYCGPAV